MKILLVAATANELAPLQNQLDKGVIRNGRLTAFCYKDFEVDILLTGVGMVPAATWCCDTLNNFKYDLVVNAGICGSFKKDLSIGKVVRVVWESFPELGVEDGRKYHSIFELNLAKPDEFPFTEGKLFSNETGNSHVISDLPEVEGITVNTVHGNAFSIRKLLSRIQPDVETMEGAAVMYVCKSLKIPVMQVRSVSNFVEKRNISTWNIPLAINNLNEMLLQMLEGF